MPSSYTPSGVELIGPGEQSGSWNVTTNTNLQILDRMVSQAVEISLSGTTHTLTLSDGVLSDGQYAVLVFGGSPSGTNTVTISPNDARRTYFVKNDSGETVVLTQGSGANVSVDTGKGAIVYCDGAGSNAEVVDLTATFTPSLASLGITATTAEINILDGATVTTAELNILTGVTATAAEINVLDGVTATAAEINVLDGVTATTAEINTLDGINTASNFGLVPSGGIIMWSGSIATVPSGWFLCDGTNGTPNLTGRFVVHADADTGGTYAPGGTGGVDSVTLTEAQIPGHTHTFSGTTGVTAPFTQGVVTVGGAVRAREGNGAYAEDQGTGSHSHTFSGTTASTGGGESHTNLPPYYALAYIMKA